MTGQQLKNSILQMAVQGKLVPQDPDDEPASVLLERIRKEKERLVREKKIKLEKNPSVIFRGADNLPYEKRGKEVRCIADEVPFEIPDSWEWARLGSVIELQSGQDLTPDKYNAEQHGIPYITGASNIEAGKVIINRWTEYARAFAYQGELLLTCKGTVGTMAILQEEKVHIARQIMAIHPIKGIEMDFLQMVIESFVDELQSAAKSMIPGITREDILTAFFPIPSQSEQKRIINRYYDVLPLVEEYGAKEDALSKLNASLPAILKKSILQEAIQGKLVPQDPNDEPASVLLERIHKEKARLVKEGKLKPDKHESVIFRRDNSHYEKRDGKETCIDDEIPFEIPASWEWTRLGTILLKAATGPFGSMLHKSDYVSDGVPLINPANIHDGTISDEGIKNVAPATASKLEAYRLAAGDVIIGRRGELGRSAVVGNEHQYWLCGTGCFFVTPANGFLAEYLVFLLSSPYVRDSLMTASVGTTMNNLNHDILKQLLVPLPPSVEQLRILNQFTTVCSMAAW